MQECRACWTDGYIHPDGLCEDCHDEARGHRGGYRGGPRPSRTPARPTVVPDPSLPVLRGSAKQVVWANEIRADLLRRVGTMTDGPHRSEFLDTMRSALARAKKEDRAWIWIDGCRDRDTKSFLRVFKPVNV